MTSLRAIDPRWYQIAVLTSLAIYGATILRLDLSWARLVVSTVSAVGLQFLFARRYKLTRFEWKSALISGLSLALLMRSNTLGVIILAAAIAIGSKFLIRVRDRHIFNPTNLALVVMLLLFPSEVWVSPAQWGSAAIFAAFVGCLGAGVAGRAMRLDVSLAFLASFVGLLLLRAAWLGDPLTIPLHQMKSGALVIFVFFMISDPRTTPTSRGGRLLFAFAVAAVAHIIRFYYFEPNALLYSLVLVSILVPILNVFSSASPYEWNPRSALQPSLQKA